MMFLNGQDTRVVVRELVSKHVVSTFTLGQVLPRVGETMNIDGVVCVVRHVEYHTRSSNVYLDVTIVSEP
jgi:hypothetical protein